MWLTWTARVRLLLVFRCYDLRGGTRLGTEHQMSARHPLRWVKRGDNSGRPGERKGGSLAFAFSRIRHKKEYCQARLCVASKVCPWNLPAPPGWTILWTEPGGEEVLRRISWRHAVVSLHDSGEQGRIMRSGQSCSLPYLRPGPLRATLDKAGDINAHRRSPALKCHLNRVNVPLKRNVMLNEREWKEIPSTTEHPLWYDERWA